MIRDLLTLALLASFASAAACGPAEIRGTAADEEATPTPGSTPDPTLEPYRPISLQQGLQRFGECMEYSTFETTGMPDVSWQSAQSEAGGGRCYSCHETGTAGAMLSIDPMLFFGENQKMPFVMKLVGGVVDENGAFADLVPAWRFRDKGMDPNHPEFILTSERELALKEFVDQTLARYHQYDMACTPAP